jgi:photosystem II Psb27 protein
MKQLFSRLLALVLVVSIALTGCSGNSVTGFVGNYRQDTATLLESLRTAIELPQDSPDRMAAQTKARQSISDFAARYRRDKSLTKLPSFTTMLTALNSLAAHYNSYPNRPLPQKLKDRLNVEFNQVEAALNRGS